MTDLIKNLAKQIIKERFSERRWHSEARPDLQALMMACGGRMQIVLPKTNSHVNGTITMAECVLHGVHPIELVRDGTPLQYQSTVNFINEEHGLGHPLQLAAFFSVFGMHQHAWNMMELRGRLLKTVQDKDTRGRQADPTFEPFNTISNMLGRTWIPPDFNELNLPKGEMHLSIDTFFLAGAYNDQQFHQWAMDEAVSVASIQELAGIYLVKNGTIPHDLQMRAFNKLRELATSEKKGGFPYDSIASMAKIAPRNMVDKLYERLKGARVMVALFRDDAESDLYVRGLRELAGSSSEMRHWLLPHLGRGPTIEEVRAVRKAGIVSILDEIDWKLVAGIMDDDDLLAIALPWAEKLGPDLIRRFRTPHPNRTVQQRLGYQVISRTNTTTADWDVVMTRLHKSWTECVRVRTQLMDLTHDQAVTYLALLGPFDRTSEEIDSVLRAHPKWAQIEAVVAGFTAPDMEKLWT